MDAEIVNMGIISIIPAVIAIVLSFATRNTIVSLVVACIIGTLLSGQGLLGFPTLLKTSLGTTSFSWVMLLNTLIAIIVAYFQKTGAIQSFSQAIHDRNLSRRGAQLMAWLLGIFVYFSDSFSPLFVGSTMRSITDKAKISREKLAYIADSTSAPVSVLVPITGWAAYLSGLAVGIGCIVTEEDGSALFLKAIPYNFYAILAVIMVGLIGSGIIKDFGPMKKAEERAQKEGKVLRDGAVPLIGKELTEMKPYPGIKPRVFVNFILPVLMIITIALSTYITMGSAKTMEAFLFVVIFMTISMVLQGIPFQEVMDTLTQGIKGAVPAVTLLALAYSINALSKSMGTANYIVSLPDTDAASGYHLRDFRNHGICNRIFLGNLCHLYADRPSTGICFHRWSAWNSCLRLFRRCCRRWCIWRPLFSAVRYHGTFFYRICCRPHRPCTDPASVCIMLRYPGSCFVFVNWIFHSVKKSTQKLRLGKIPEAGAYTMF